MSRAEEARQLKENKLLQDIFSDIESAIVSGLKSCDMNNEKTRLWLTTSLQTFAQIEAHIESCITDETINKYNAKQKKKFGIL